MGKGDTKTKRGKINVGSYGNARKKLKAPVIAKSGAGAAKKPEAKKTATKAPVKRVAKK